VLLVVVCLSGEAKSLSKKAIAACVGAHNKLRELHVDTPKLQWSPSLAAKAQAYAEKLVQENKKSSKFYFEHSTDRKNIGENLSWRNNRQLGTCVDASHSWYKEIKDYSFQTTESINGKKIGHFTQLVWKDTTHFGVGIATMPARKYGEYGNKETFIVAMYSPQGNFHYIGKKVEAYTANVKPRKDGCTGSNCYVPTVEKLNPSSVKPPPPPPSTKPTTTCENKISNCQNLFDEGYKCNAFKTFFKKNCFMACGYC